MGQQGVKMIFQLTVPQFTKMLTNLKNVLEKGRVYSEAKKVDFDVFLNSRLAPDQFNLTRQIQIACDTAKLGAARLSGKTAPVDEDKETTLSQLFERIERVQIFLNSLNESDFAEAESKTISQPRWEGKYLTGEEFLIQHALPNLYFHITTAYSILRHNGVDVGKKDYLGPMPYKS